MSTITNCYSKNHRVRMTNSRSEDRFKDIHVTIDYQTTTVPTLKKELIIKLTDENDPFFLYSRFLGEDDYQMLKAQQGFLVDHGSFGTHLIELLKKCEEEQAADSPKYQFQIHTKEPLPHDHGPATMNIVEMNIFRHLQHITLNLAPANDSEIKKYLATCWQNLREAHSKLGRQHEDLKIAATQEVKNLQMALSMKSSEYDRLKIESDSLAESKNNERMKELNFEREKALQNQHALQQKLDIEKKEFEQMHLKKIKSLESHVNELEQQNKELLEIKFRCESQLQEVRAKYTTVHEEYTQLKLDVQQLRKENTNLENLLHKGEKDFGAMNTKAAVLEQELKDKNDKISTMQELLANEQALRRQKEDLLKEREERLKRTVAQLTHAKGELEKGNVSYGKLKLELSETRKKLADSTNNTKNTEQQKHEKEREIESLNVEIRKLKDQICNLNQEKAKAETQCEKLTSDLDELTKLHKKNEQMIHWLNKKTNMAITIQGTNGSYDGSNGAGSGGTVSFKPHGNLLSNGGDTIDGNGILKMSTTMNQYTAKSNHTNGNNTDFMNTLNSTSGRNMSGLPLSYTSNPTTNFQSRLSSESHDNCESPTSSMSNMGTNRLTIAPVTNPTGPPAPISNRLLDAKYFQNHSPPMAFDSNSHGFKPLQSLTRATSAATNSSSTAPSTTTTATNNAITSNSMDTNAKSAPIKSNLLTNATNTTASNSNGGQLYNGARLNKQLIQQPSMVGQSAQPPPFTALIPSKSTPPIASAYFPN